MRNPQVVKCLRALMGTGISRNKMLAKRSARHNGTKVLGLADKVQRCWHLGTRKGCVAAPFFWLQTAGPLSPWELSRKFDAGLGAGDQTRDIRPVLQQNEDGDEHGSQRDKFRRRMARRVQDINEDRQR